MTSQPHTVSRGARESRVDDGLLWIVDLGLAAIVLVVPLLLGGSHAVGRLVLVSCVSVASSAWLIRYCLEPSRGWRRSGAEWLLVAGLMLVGFQLVPLPPAVLDRVSPALREILPVWTEDADASAQIGVWSTVSLFPDATRGGLVMLLAYSMLFLLTVQRLNSVSDAERLMRLVASATVGIAVLGLVQYLVGNGKFLWVYEHPFTTASKTVKGPFSNENHLAHFLALGIGPLLWWVQHQARAQRGSRRTSGRHSGVRQSTGGDGSKSTPSSVDGFGKPSHAKSAGSDVIGLMLGAGLGGVAFAGLLTYSRGGVLVLLLSAAIGVGLCVARSLLGRRSLATLGLVAVTACVALYIHGYQTLSGQLATIQAGSFDELNQSLRREVVWGANSRAIPDFLWLGAGIGSHQEICHRYLDRPSRVEFTHAESGYLQTLVEAGLPGMTLVLAGAGLAGFWCWRSLRCVHRPDIMAISVAVVPGLAVSLIHSVADFVWYIPACMVLTILLLACACRMSQLAQGAEDRYRFVPATRWIPLLGSGCVVAVSVFMIGHWVPAARASADWDQYQRWSSLNARALLRWFPVDGSDAGVVAGPSREEMIRRMERILERNPKDARAHQTLARLYLYEFEARQATAENAMPLNQIRDAALSSGFRSREDLDRWLGAAVGENSIYLERALRHAHQAVRSCPLQGEAYLSLAELMFLEGRPVEAKQELLEQALAVRPQDGLVLLQAGLAAAMENDLEVALDRWKRSFHSGPHMQARIVQSLSEPIANMLQEPNPAAYFLENFEPDFTATRLMYASYRRAGQVEQAKIVGQRYIGQLESAADTAAPAEATEWWLEAQDVHALLGQLDQAVECAQRAVQSSPSDLRCHRILAQRLTDANRIAEAIDELRWCQQRSPDDARLEGQLKSLIRQLDREPQLSSTEEETTTRR